MASSALRPFAGKVALVTGASRGIGHSVALELSRRGAHVIACGRTVGGLEALDDAIRAAGGEAPTLAPFDLRDHPAIDRLGQAINERWGRLDLMVGNAGVLGTLTPVAHLDPKVFAEVMDVNVAANYRLIRSMDPNLRLSPSARALFVSSGAAVSPRAYWGAYAASKAALEALVTCYAQECASTQVRVSLYDPGRTRTAMRGAAMPGEDPMVQTDPALVATHICDHLADEKATNGARLKFALPAMSA